MLSERGLVLSAQKNQVTCSHLLMSSEINPHSPLPPPQLLKFPQETWWKLNSL